MHLFWPLDVIGPLAIAVGVLVIVFRKRVAAWQTQIRSRISGETQPWTMVAWGVVVAVFGVLATCAGFGVFHVVASN